MVKKSHEVRENQFLFENVQIEIFEIFIILKYNMKITSAACWINSKISSMENSTTFLIFWYCY